MCYKCFRFGHVQSQCRGKQLCDRCGNPSHDNPEVCPNFVKDPVCINCKNNHLLKDRNCPEWSFQSKVRTLAAASNISLGEAFTYIMKTDPPSHSSRTHMTGNKSTRLRNNLSSFSQNYLSSQSHSSVSFNDSQDLDSTPPSNQHSNPLDGLNSDSEPYLSYSHVSRNNFSSSFKNPVNKPVRSKSNFSSFSRDSHNDCLYAPNGRTPSSQPSQSKTFFPPQFDPCSNSCSPPILSSDFISLISSILSGLLIPFLKSSGYSVFIPLLENCFAQFLKFTTVHDGATAPL